MKCYILLQTAAIFFLSNLYLKQGIGWVYVTVNFICKDYSCGERESSENYKMKNFFPIVGFESETFQ